MRPGSVLSNRSVLVLRWVMYTVLTIRSTAIMIAHPALSPVSPMTMGVLTTWHLTTDVDVLLKLWCQPMYVCFELSFWFIIITRSELTLHCSKVDVEINWIIENLAPLTSHNLSISTENCVHVIMSGTSITMQILLKICRVGHLPKWRYSLCLFFCLIIPSDCTAPTVFTLYLFISLVHLFCIQ